ncbi:MAG TPA: hypothetical protein VNF71_12645 [Acidimicrobiales bacterium]|nr:hypothetical protein [Acidimicrobiales bacterium]
MHDGERLIAEQDVVIRDHHVLNVRISEHMSESFWRLDVSNPAALRASMTTTVSETDSFLMHLINDAVSGQSAAWRQLAEWGHENLSRPAPGFRLAPAG